MMKYIFIKKIDETISYVQNNKYNVILWSVAIFIMCFGMTINRYFGVVEIEQAIFHISSPLQGIDKRLISGFFRHSILQPAIYIIISLFVFISFPKLAKKIKIFSVGLMILALVRIFFCFTGYIYLAGYLTADEHSPDFYREHIVQPEASSVSFSEKRNLIVLYLESLEASFSDKNIFPANLLPRLTEWRTRHASIKNAFQAHNTGWTIAGIVSSWSGLPLRAGAGVKNNTFMPDVIMVPDILAHHGYTLKYVQGTSLDFTGKKYLFLSHGFTPEEYIGLETVLKEHPDWKTKYHGPSDWGLRDSVTYTLAKDSLLKLSRTEKPFALFMLTVNPHFSKGLVEPKWHGPLIEGFNNDEQAYADVVTNADMLASEFLHWISKQDFAPHTTVIVLSDHFVMGTALSPFLKAHSEDRRNLNIIINPVRPVRTEGRAISHFDWAPTMLEAIGANLPDGRMGLGVSLFSDKKTLVEKLGIQKLNHELKKYSQYYADIAIENS